MEWKWWNGCLSLPHHHCSIIRHTEVWVTVLSFSVSLVLSAAWLFYYGSVCMAQQHYS